MLFGLVAKNGILLVDYANTMRHRGMWVVEATRAAEYEKLTGKAYPSAHAEN